MPKIEMQKIQEEVKKLVAEIAEIDERKVTLDANFVEDLGMDSMMALEILASLEKKFKIKIPEENLSKMTSLKQLLDLTEKYME